MDMTLEEKKALGTAIWQAHKSADPHFIDTTQVMKVVEQIRADAYIAGQKVAEDPSVSADKQGPDDGHTFRFTAECRGSYAVVGEPHNDSQEFDQPLTFEVRAWSLSAALEKASRLPFPILMASLWEDE